MQVPLFQISCFLRYMHEILATAMVLEARKDRGGQILPNLTFKIQKPHISGKIPGKIQAPLCQLFCFLR